MAAREPLRTTPVCPLCSVWPDAGRGEARACRAAAPDRQEKGAIRYDGYFDDRDAAGLVRAGASVGQVVPEAGGITGVMEARRNGL